LWLICVGMVKNLVFILRNIFKIWHLTSVYNFIEDLMNIGQNLSRCPLYPSMSPEVEFYIFMTKWNSLKSILCNVLKKCYDNSNITWELLS
jgi:hypothetical protein